MSCELLFSERVKGLRLQHKLTQKDLGDAIGLSHKTISMMEKGTQGTTLEKLVLLAKFFNVSTDYLVGLKDEP